MKTIILATAALLAAPAIAQTAPSAAPVPPGADAPRRDGARAVPRGAMFPNVSPEGRAILRETLREGSPEDRAALMAARDRINSLVGAERLDVAALKRAMDDERRLVDSHHAKRQANMLAAIQKLSPADRKAFAEDARNARARVEARTSQWRKGGGERGPGGPGQPGTQRPLL